MSRTAVGLIGLTTLALLLMSLGVKSTNRSTGNDVQLAVGSVLFFVSFVGWIIWAVRPK